MQDQTDNPASSPAPQRRRKEPKIFTIWVHVGYTVLIASTFFWIYYVESILD